MYLFQYLVPKQKLIRLSVYVTYFTVIVGNKVIGEYQKTKIEK